MEYQLIFIICIALNLFFVTADDSEIFKPILKPEEGTKNYDFVLERKRIERLSRTVWTINDQYPGPLININKNDRVIIKVKNLYGDPATIHWHGIYQRNTNWYDGVPGQTQCPIPSNVSFTYQFDVCDQAGTYWYHSHFLAQYADGLIGPFIVHDLNDPYFETYDVDYVITVGDWYKDPTGNILEKGPGGLPQSALISGRSCDSEEPSFDTDSCAVYKVERGKKYRFRIINTSAFSYMNFGIANHKLKIIEVEGILVGDIESTVESISLHAGQRYSVILNADQEPCNYEINAETICPGTPGRVKVRGFLQYEGANDIICEGQLPVMTECEDPDPNLIRPLDKSLNPPEDFENRTIVVTRDTSGERKFYINGSTYAPWFNYPTNQRVIDNENYVGFHPQENSVFYDNNVQIIIFNHINEPHPIHIHGHHFWVMGAGVGLTESDVKYYEYDDNNPPPMRDTALIPGSGYLVVRFKADNPGIWALHCHMEWHVEEGFVAQLIERQADFHDNYEIPQDVRKLCVQYDYEPTDKKRKRSRLHRARINY